MEYVFQPGDEELYSFKEGLAGVKRNGKCGYIDEMGKEVIPCIYKMVTPFKDGVAIVITENDRRIAIDKTGKEVELIDEYNSGLEWDLKQKFSKEKIYTNVDRFHRGFAVVRKQLGWGMINKDGNEVIPCKYQYVSRFTEGIAKVKLEDKWGTINKNGEIVDDFEYTREEIFDKYKIKDNGIKPEVKNGKIGFVDREGKLIADYIYDYIELEICERL